MLKFSKNVRKTFYSSLTCLIILISNISMITIAGDILYYNDTGINEEDLLIKDLDVVDKKLYTDNVKYIFRVFENSHPELYKKCVVYYIILDHRNNDFSQKDLIETVTQLLKN